MRQGRRKRLSPECRATPRRRRSRAGASDGSSRRTECADHGAFTNGQPFAPRLAIWHGSTTTTPSNSRPLAPLGGQHDEVGPQSSRLWSLGSMASRPLERSVVTISSTPLARDDDRDSTGRDGRNLTTGDVHQSRRELTRAHLINGGYGAGSAYGARRFDLGRGGEERGRGEVRGPLRACGN